MLKLTVIIVNSVRNVKTILLHPHAVNVLVAIKKHQVVNVAQKIR